MNLKITSLNILFYVLKIIKSSGLLLVDPTNSNPEDFINLMHENGYRKSSTIHFLKNIFLNKFENK